MTPSLVTTTIASAVTTAGTSNIHMANIDRASIQLTGSLTSTDTSVITLLISNDGVNFVPFPVTKTVTFTGGGTVSVLFDLGSINYEWLQVSWGAPSANALTLVMSLKEVSTQVQQA